MKQSQTRILLATFLLLSTGASSAAATTTTAFVSTKPIHHHRSRSTRNAAGHVHYDSPVFFVNPKASTCVAKMGSTDQEDGGTSSGSSGSEAAAQTLRDKAAQIRAEIAALEGKTVEQVEKEATEKKQQQTAALEASRKARQERDAKSPPRDYGRMLEVPETKDQMIVQAARAMERAFHDGVKRQTVRLALVKEDQPFTEENQWPGGAEQMYREAAKPLTYELMKTLRLSKDQIRSLNVTDQDIWDFDGSGLITGQSDEGPKGDVQALVFPNTDVKYTNDIDEIDQAIGKDRLFFLVNPFWRDLESWGINILAPGAKKKAKEIIFDKGYDESYVFLRFSCRGEDCVAIKAYPYDWQIFAYYEDNEFGNSNWPSLIRLGSTKDEPRSKYVTELINERPEFKLSKTMRQLKR